MVGTISRSFALVKECFNVLKHDKEIMWFPILSGIVSIVLLLTFILPLVVFQFVGGTLSYVFFFFYYLISYFVVIFFNTALISCAHIRLNGGDPTVKDGLNAATKNIGKIFSWALVSATVGIVLRAIADKMRNNLVGRILVSIIGMAWGLLTFFVIPIMVFENIGVIDAIKRSGALFKNTWGENVVGQFSIGTVFFLLGLLGLLPIALIVLFPSGIMIALALFLMIAYWVGLGILSAALNGIFITALYMYATTGKVPAALNEEVVKGAFTQKAPMGMHKMRGGFV